MADVVGQPPPLDAVQPADRRDNDAAERHGRDGEARRQPVPEPPLPRNIDDVVFIMGVPQAEVTPAVRGALGHIMAEFDRIRVERDRLREQVSYLTELADGHAFLPVLNRRALQRELARVLSRLQQAGTEAAFLYLGFVNLGDVLAGHGRAAADAALIKAANVVRQHIRASDVLGEMGTGDFGLILSPIDPETAVAKAREIAAAVEQRTAEKEGGALGLRVVWGLRHLASGEEPRQIFADAAEAARPAG
jgi:diguanylate cyclase (GGDEF)-like protein